MKPISGNWELGDTKAFVPSSPTVSGWDSKVPWAFWGHKELDTTE